jgi:glycine dehydrogenase subunit 1
LFASKNEYVRSMPGRLVGKTVDRDGRKGFVLTLGTREQHIRRERATSNICTNNNLCALAAAMFMASVGKAGIMELARLNHDKSEYLKNGLSRAGFDIPFKSPTFNEFVVKLPSDYEDTGKHLLGKKIIAGLSIGKYYAELYDHYLFCVTETKSKNDLDFLVGEMCS